ICAASTVLSLRPGRLADHGPGRETPGRDPAAHVADDAISRITLLAMVSLAKVQPEPEASISSTEARTPSTVASRGPIQRSTASSAAFSVAPTEASADRATARVRA